jgi:hypothetical protein
MSSLPPDRTYKIENTGLASSDVANRFLALHDGKIGLRADSTYLEIRVWSDFIGIFPISYNVLIVESQGPNPAWQPSRRGHYPVRGRRR